MASSLLIALSFQVFLFSLSLFNQMQFSTSLSPLCHNEERLALLQFKQSFVLNKSASGDRSAYPKVKSWNQRRKTRECCLWDGVECDRRTGHVISLDLGSSYLYGSINSSSSLFQLVHLRRLSLADNNFNYSRIPLGFRHLSMLTHLDLSFSGFYGQIPLEIFELIRLTSLDLSGEVDFSGAKYLHLRSPGLKRLVENLTSIQTLWLANVDISSEVPISITNLSSLRYLYIKNCGIFGRFPMEIFNLPKLQELSVPMNANLKVYLPEFQWGSPLEMLWLEGTNFSGGLPTSIGNLHSLTWLDISSCNFYGPLPSSLGNLTQLESLTLTSNRLTGQIPLFLANLTQLIELRLDNNELHGPIPDSFSKLLNLKILYLADNHLSGNVNLDMFFNLENLAVLQIGVNDFSSLIETNQNATIPKWRMLGFAHCNLRKFPNFLRHQDKLLILELSENNIEGLVPNWLWNVGRETMWHLGLESNSLTDFEKPLSISSMSKLLFLYIKCNKLQGPIPIPPPFVVEYEISNTSLTAEIPRMLCNLPDLYSLDLSHNNLSGIIPQCLFNVENSLTTLNMRHNSLHGTIPETFNGGSKLKMIDLSHNELQGKIPMSLANQIVLESLNLGDNKIADKFPHWLGALPNLAILILRSNKLFGDIGMPTVVGFNFSMLRIIDLSYNGFTGALPSKYFQNWNSMRNFNKDQFSYMEETIMVSSYAEKTTYHTPVNYYYQLSMINKGVDMEYSKIPNILVAIDLSCNKFEGNIPKSIFTLKKLQSLNLSNNHLSGYIPSQIMNLTELESLDLSGNMLTGVIPQQLVHLTFLSSFNVSHNKLMSPIPHGKQFDTYENSSYMDNPGLCGKPLSNMCGNAPPASTVEDNKGSDSSVYVEWKAAIIGYCSGLVVALAITHGIWIMKTFRRRQAKRRS